MFSDIEYIASEMVKMLDAHDLSDLLPGLGVMSHYSVMSLGLEIDEPRCSQLPKRLVRSVFRIFDEYFQVNYV